MQVMCVLYWYFIIGKVLKFHLIWYLYFYKLYCRKAVQKDNSITDTISQEHDYCRNAAEERSTQEGIHCDLSGNDVSITGVSCTSNEQQRIREEHTRQVNRQRQRKYMANLRTPEMAHDLLSHKEWRNTWRRELYAENRRKSKKAFIAWHSLSTFDESSVTSHDIGRMVYTCSECGALMYKGEKSDKSLSADNTTAKFALCCSYGDIKLPPIKEPPDELKHILSGNTKSDQNFRYNIRAYNSSLAFASMCLTKKEYKFNIKYPYCFRISDQIYHALSQMQPEIGSIPRYSQIYIYDQEHELDNHLHTFGHLDGGLLKQLQDMIKKWIHMPTYTNKLGRSWVKIQHRTSS